MVPPTTPGKTPTRSGLWQFIESNHSCLIDIAREIATGFYIGRSGSVDVWTSELSIITSGLKRGLNFLANADSAGLKPTLISHFDGRRLPDLVPLANAKAGRAVSTSVDQELSGFVRSSNRANGLAILFSPWTDWCLECWRQYSFDNKPLLILSTDYHPLFNIKHELGLPDWGEHHLKKDFCHGTKKVFVPTGDPSLDPFIKGICAVKVGTESINEFIGRRRVIVYNVWPYFRRGDDACGDCNVPKPFLYHSIQHSIEELIKCIQPAKIATWGNWAYNEEPKSLEKAIRSGTSSWFSSVFLTNGSFHRISASDSRIIHFYHPCRPSHWNGPLPGDPSKNNKVEFENFIR